jgi:hypothetical protein
MLLPCTTWLDRERAHPDCLRAGGHSGAHILAELRAHSDDLPADLHSAAVIDGSAWLGPHVRPGASRSRTGRRFWTAAWRFSERAIEPAGTRSSVAAPATRSDGPGPA